MRWVEIRQFAARCCRSAIEIMPAFAPDRGTERLPRIMYPFDESRRRRSRIRHERQAAKRVPVQETSDVVAVSRRRPVDGRQFEQAVLGPGGEQTEHIAQVRPGLDVAEPTAGEQRGEGRIHGAGIIMTGRTASSCDRQLADAARARSSCCEWEAAVFEKTRKPNALVARVADAVGDRRIVEHERCFSVAPGEEATDDRGRAFQSDRLALLPR